MAKEKSSMQSSQKKANKPAQDRKKTVVIIAVVITVLSIIAWFGTNKLVVGGDSDKTRSFYVKGGENRPVLDPDQFYGMTRSAYAAAAEIPHILDKLYCYCDCNNPPFHHKSLLSCFVTDHGAG